MSTSCPPYTSKPWQKKRVQPGRWKAVPQCSESPWPCESVRASAGVCCASHASVAQFPTFSRFMTRCRTKDTGTRLSVQPWHKCHRIRLQGRRRLLSYCTSPTETTAGATPTEAGGASDGAAGAWAGDRAQELLLWPRAAGFHTQPHSRQASKRGPETCRQEAS